MQTWIVGLLLALTALPAGAATFDVTARGKDEAAARAGAQVNAVRTCMQSMVSGEFLRANMEAVRTGVILKSQDFVRSVTVNGQSRSGGIILLEAAVDVDEKALADTLSAMPMDEASRQRMTAALEAMQPTSPVQEGSARAAAASQAPAPQQSVSSAAGAVGAVTPEGMSSASKVPQSTPRAALPESTLSAPEEEFAALKEMFSDDDEYVTDDNIFGSDVYIEDMKTLSGLFPPQLQKLLLDDEERAVVEMLFALNVRGLRLRLDKENDYETLLAEVPAGKDLGALTRSHQKLRDVALLLGLSETQFTPDMQELLDLPLQDTGVAGVQHVGALFLSFTDSFVIAGNHLPNVAQARAMVLEGTLPFAVAGDAPLRICTRDGWLSTSEEDDVEMNVLKMTWGATPVEGGWLVRGTSTMADRYPSLRRAAAVNLEELLLDREKPFFLLGFGNSEYVKQLLAEAGFGGNGAVDGVQEALLSLGGGHTVAGAQKYPAVTLGVRGTPAALGALVSMTEDGSPWQNVTVDGWDMVRVQSLQQIVGLPLNAVMAQKKNTLFCGVMDTAALAASQDTRALLEASLEGSGAKMPEQVSSVMMLDVRKMWQELSALLADPMLGSLVDMAQPGLRAPLQKLFAATPPVSCVTGWTDCPDMSASTLYIAVTKESTDAFYAVLEELMDGI